MSEDFPGGWQVLHFAKEIVVKKRFLLASQKDIYDIINYISFKGKKGLRPSIFLLKLKRCNELESPPCPFEILKHEKPISPFFYPVFVDISKRLLLVWKWKEGPNSVLVVCGLHSGLWFWSVHLLRKLASSQILLFVFIYSGLWFWSIKLLCKLYKRVSSHYFYFLFLIFLSLTFHPSFVSYYYV